MGNGKWEYVKWLTVNKSQLSVEENEDREDRRVIEVAERTRKTSHNSAHQADGSSHDLPHQPRRQLKGVTGQYRHP